MPAIGNCIDKLCLYCGGIHRSEAYALDSLDSIDLFDKRCKIMRVGGRLNSCKNDLLASVFGKQSDLADDVLFIARYDLSASLLDNAIEISKNIKPNDIIVTLGAGTITKLGNLIEEEHKICQ